jgi:uncharacterized protein
VDALFRTARARGYRHVKLKYAGGEPLLNAETLWATQAYAEAVSARAGIPLTSGVLTNGTRTTDADMDALTAHNVKLSVSLDALPGASTPRSGADGCLWATSGGSSTVVLRTLDRLATHGISPHISITITAWNLPGLPALVRELLARQLPFSFNFVRPVEGADAGLLPETTALTRGLTAAYDVIASDLPAYSLLGMLADRANLAAPHLHTCGMGRNYMVVDVEGGVHLCQMELGAGHPVSNVSDLDPLAAVQTFGEVRNPSVTASASCTTCPWVYYCTGGCPRLRDPRTGRSPLCEVYRTILPAVVRLEGQRLLRYGERRVFGAA